MHLFQRPPRGRVAGCSGLGTKGSNAICDVCAIRLSATMLPCGHAVCMPCIQGVISCRKCAHPIPGENAPRMTREGAASDPLAYLHSAVNIDAEATIQPDERILLPVQCDIVSPFLTVPGELLIGTNNIYFKETPNPTSARDGVKKHLESVIAFGTIDRDPGRLPYWPNSLVVEAHPRRYLLQRTALEVFLSNGTTVLFACRSQRGRDEALALLRGGTHFPRLRKVRNVGASSIEGITASWVHG